MAELTDNQRLKLAFVLHAVYGVRDLAYGLLAQVDEGRAEKYLVKEGMTSTPQTISSQKPLRISAVENSSTTLVFYPDYSHANPYQKLLYSIFPEEVSIAPGLPWSLPVSPRGNKIFHFHWEDIVYRNAKNEKEAIAQVDGFLEKLKGAKKDGWKILWTIHNEAPHENRFPAADRHIRLALSGLTDLVLVHSEAAKIIQERDLPQLKGKVRVMPHGNYEGCYPKNISRAEARSKLGLSESQNVFLFFGNVRLYKGLDDLLKAFSAPEIQRTNSILMIAGIGPAHQYVEKFYSGNPDKIRVINNHIQDDEIQDYFASADFSVYAFKKILSSGSVLLSYTFSTPVIIPEFESMTEFVGEGRGSISYRPNNVGSLRKAISKCCKLSASEKVLLNKQASSVLAEYRWTNFSNVAYEIIFESGSSNKSKSLFKNSVKEKMAFLQKTARSLTLLVFGKGVSDIERWIERHKESQVCKYQIIFAFWQGNNFSLESAIPANFSGTVSEFQDENLIIRLAKTLENITSPFVLLCAADDEVLTIPDFFDQDDIGFSPDVVGYSGKVIFRYPDGALWPAQTNEIDLSMGDQLGRLVNYWTFPFPADNSIFYSIFKTSSLVDAIKSVGDSAYEAWDWVCVTSILRQGRFEKSDLMIVRDKTPSLNYTKSYIDRHGGHALKNPLFDALERLKEILSDEQYQAIYPEVVKWLAVKSNEVDFLSKKYSAR